MPRARCRFCGEHFAKKGIARHLVSCAPKHVDEPSPPLKTYYQFAISSDDAPRYWLYLLVDPASTLRQLDQFIRDTWVECCDHLSCFEVGGRQYCSDEASGPGSRGMAVRLMDLPGEQLRMLYVYDFGSSTVLNIRSVSPVEYADNAGDFIVAARNQPPPYSCSCGNRASILVRDAMDDRDSQAFYCEQCITEYEGDLSSLSPLTNSPRMGICGYYGPSGDQQGEYESFERAEEVIRDFYRNHDVTRLSAGDAAERERIIRRYIRFLHSRSVDEDQLRRARFIYQNITHFAPELRKLLDDTLSRWRKNGKRPGSPAHICALYLLSDVADETVFADIADTFADYDSARAVWGNAIQEPDTRLRLFATLSREAPEPLIVFALQDDIDAFIRGTAINALVALYLEGSLSRDVLVDLFHRLAEQAIAEENEWIAEMTASACMAIYPEDVIRIIQRLERSGLLDESRTDYIEGVRETLTKYGREEHLGRVRSSGFYGFIEEPLEELRLALLQFETEPATNSVAHHRRDYSAEHAGTSVSGEEYSRSMEGTLYRAKKKPGRNEPCPCGSGRKYKRCCGR